jgi:hypothetical protein
MFFNGIIGNVLCVSYVWCVSKGVYYIRCRIYGILNNEVNRGVVGRVLNRGVVRLNAISLFLTHYCFSHRFLVSITGSPEGASLNYDLNRGLVGRVLNKVSLVGFLIRSRW